MLTKFLLLEFLCLIDFYYIIIKKKLSILLGSTQIKKLFCSLAEELFGLGRDVTIKILSAFIHNIGNYQIVAISGKTKK